MPLTCGFDGLSDEVSQYLKFRVIRLRLCQLISSGRINLFRSSAKFLAFYKGIAPCLKPWKRSLHKLGVGMGKICFQGRFEFCYCFGPDSSLIYFRVAILS